MMKRALLSLVLFLGLSVFAQEPAPKDPAAVQPQTAGQPAAASSAPVAAKPAPASEKPAAASSAPVAAKPAPTSEKTAPASEKTADTPKKQKTETEKTEAFVRELMSKLPVGTIVGPVDYSGKTWIMNGVYPKPFKQIKDELAEAMRAEKYQLMHEIPLTKEEDRVLVAWKKDDVKVIFMLWKRSAKETGFSMGKSK